MPTNISMTLMVEQHQTPTLSMDVHKVLQFVERLAALEPSPEQFGAFVGALEAPEALANPQAAQELVSAALGDLAIPLDDFMGVSASDWANYVTVMVCMFGPIVAQGVSRTTLVAGLAAVTLSQIKRAEAGLTKK
jgi:hypothetical protein